MSERKRKTKERKNGANVREAEFDAEITSLNVILTKRKRDALLLIPLMSGFPDAVKLGRHKVNSVITPTQ